MANTLELIIKAKDEASATLGNIKKTLGPVGGALKIISAAAVAAGAALAAAATRAAAVGDKFDKMSQRVGVSSASLSQLAFAARQSGSSIETVENSMRVLSKQMDNASLGNKTASEAFDALGISITDADGALRNKLDVLKEAADKMGGLDNETQKAALAGKIFGERYGTQLLPMLNIGSEGIEQLMQRADELGSTVDDVGAKDAAAFSDAMDEATTAIDGLTRTVGEDLLPIMTPMIKMFTDAVVSTIDWVEESHQLKDALFAVKEMLGINKTAQQRYAESVRSLTKEELQSILKVKEAEAEALKDRRLKGGNFRTEEENAKFAELQTDIEIHQKELDSRLATDKKLEEAAKTRERVRLARLAQRKAEKEEAKAEEAEEVEEEIEKISFLEQMTADAEKLGMERRIEQHKEGLAQKEEADRKAAENKRKLIEAQDQFERTAAGQLAGAIAAFGGRETAAYKTLATAQALMSTYLAATKALTLGPIMGPVKAGIITAMGLANVAKINGAKFHDGGLVGGNGEVPAVLEAGEFVIRKEAVSALGEENLQAINEGNSNVSVANFFDTDSLDEYLSSYKGQQAIINAINM